MSSNPQMVIFCYCKFYFNFTFFILAHKFSCYEFGHGFIIKIKINHWDGLDKMSCENYYYTYYEKHISTNVKHV
jgi:hypothetical protein